MTRYLSLAVALALLALFYFTGLIAGLSLSHPYWQIKATLLGGTIGVAIAIFLFWLNGRQPALVRSLVIVMAVAFPIFLFTTWYSARIFIDSADFEWLAGQVWHKAYHALVALFVALVAIILRRYGARF